MCFEGLARLSRRVWRRFVRGSREISLVPSLHRASTDALIKAETDSISPHQVDAIEGDGHCFCFTVHELKGRNEKGERKRKTNMH